MAIKLTGNPVKDNQLFQANKLNQMVADSEEFKQEQERTEIQKQAQTLLDSYNVLSKPEDVPNAYNAKTITLKKNVTPAETMNQLASDATYKYDDSGLSHIQQLRSKSTLTNDELEELKNYEKPSGIGTVAKNVGVGVLEGVDSLAHPVQTAKLLGNSYMYDTATSRSEGYDTQLASIVDYMRKNNTTTFEGLTLDQWQNKLQYQKDYNEAEAEKWSQIGQQNANKLAEKSIYGDKVDAWKESVAEDTSELGDTGQFFAGLAQSAGFMLPHVVIGAAAGQVAGAIAGGKGAAAGLTGEALAKSVATASKTASEIAGYSVMFDQVYNKQVKDLTNQGYSWKEVSDNAMLNAAKEILTEMLGGGIPGVKDSTGLLDPVLDATVGRVVRKVNNSVGAKLAAKYAANAIADGVATTSEGLIISGLTGQIVKGLSTSTGKFITDMIGEGAEEAIATYIEPYIDRMTINPNADSATLSELGLSFLGGAVMGGFFNAFNLASTKASANGQVVLYNNGEITLKNASELSQADLDADTKEYNQTAEQFAELYNNAKMNDLAQQAAEGAEQMGFDPASVNEMTNDELIRFAKVAKNNAQDVNTSTVYEGDIPEGFDVTAPTGRTYKTFTAENLQLDDPNLVDKLQARTTMLYAMKSIITGLTDSQAEAFGRSGMGSIGGLDTRFMDFKMPTNIDRMTSADIQQWYTDNVVPAFIRQNEYNARRTSQVARGEELRTYDKTYATRDEFAQMYYQNVPVAEQTPEMMNKAFDVYDRLMEEQRVKQDNFLGNVKYQFSRFGLNARFMTAEEMADPEIGSNNAFYDVETKTVVLNRATITTIEAARIAVAHELVHAIENLNAHSKSEVNRLRGMIDSAMEELGITRDEWVSELQEVYLPKYREWSVKLGRAGYTADQIEAQIKQALNEEADAYFIQTILANPQVLLTIATNEKDIVNALEAFVTSVSSADPKSVLTEYEQAIADKLSDINKIANKTAEAREKMLEQNAQDEIEAQKKAKSSKNTAKQYAKYKSKALNSRESYQVTGVDELEGSEKYLGKNGDTDEIWIKLSSYLHPKNKDVSAETKDWLIKNGYTYDNNLGVYITPFTQEAWDITGEAGKDLDQLKAANNAKQTLSDTFAQARKDFNDSFEETNENIMIDINEIFNMKDEEVKPTNKYLKDTDKIEVTYAGDVSEVYGASLYADFLADIKDGNEEGIVKIKNKRTNKTLFDVAKPDKTISADGVTKVDFTGARTTNIDAKKVIDEAINEYKTSKGSQQVRATALANKIVQFDLSKDRIDEIIETLGGSRTEINRLRNALRPIEAPKFMANMSEKMYNIPEEDANNGGTTERVLSNTQENYAGASDIRRNTDSSQRGVSAVQNNRTASSNTSSPNGLSENGEQNGGGSNTFSFEEKGGETEQTVLNNLKKTANDAEQNPDSYRILSQNRLEMVVNASISKGRPDYAKYYLAWVDPAAFVNATIPESYRSVLDSETRDTFDTEESLSKNDWAYLIVNDNIITGHEGRHRLNSMAKNGIKKVAIPIRIESQDTYNSKPILQMTLEGQEFINETAKPITLENLMPVSERYIDIDKALFSDLSAPKYMASFSDIRNAAAEDYYDTVDMYGDPFELTDDEIYRNFNALDDELERQWEKAQDDYTTYRYGTPKSVSPGTRTSRVADNILNGNNTEQFTEATRKNVLNGLFSYVRIPNKQREANAQAFWNNKRWLNDEGKFDIVKALESWSDKVESGEATPDLAAEGGVLLAKIRDASVDHNLTEPELRLLERLEADMAVLSVNSASTTQYFAHINKMTGDGRSYYMNRMLGELKKDLNEMASAFRLKAKNALDDYEIPEGLDALLRSPMNEELIKTADISETLRNKLTQTSSMEGRITLVQEAIKDDIAAHIPPTLGSRITAWRMLSMLGNIRTHLRNIVSNAAMYIARNLRDVQVGAIEDVFLKNTDYTKSKSFVGALSTELKQMAIDQYNLHAKEIQEGGKLGFKADVMERVNSFGQSVGGRFLEKLSRWNSELLESEDAWFLRANFKQAFASYAKANAKRWGTTEADVTTFLNSPTTQSVQALNETLDYAIKEAKRATYREADALATWLTHQEKKGTLQGILIEGILPFKRTPINILKQGVRYSPIGIINGLKELTIGVKTGEIGSSYVEYNADGTIKATHKKTVDDAITDLCAGMTGTMIMGLGLFLGGTGAMKAGGSDSDREEYYDEMLGNQKYSITIGDTNLTLDWLTPISMPLFAGVTLANKLGGSEENAEEDIDFSTKFTDVLEALSNMADPFTNLSLLSGVNDALNSYSDDKLGAALLSSAENYASQFIPTLAGQIARTIDGQRRTTYAPKDSTMVGGQTAERFLNKLKAKIPFLASTNPEYVDQWGRTEEYSSELPVLGDLGVVGRAINQMATPWYSKTINSTAVDDMLSEVFAESKDNNVLPSTPSSYYTIGGEKYYLDADEYTEVKKTVGQLSYAGVDSFFSSAWLNNLTTDQQADAIANIYNYAKAVAKQDYATQSGVAGYEAESVIATVEKAQKVGLSIGDYFVLKKLLSDDVAGSKNAQKKQVGAALGLTSAQIDLFLRH